MTTDELIDGILQREGGYSDRATDRGGVTNFGITAKTLGQWRRLGRVASRAEVVALTADEARQIYRAWYVKPFDTVPFDEIRAQLADIAVTSGQLQAMTLLQRALGVEPDGVLGPRTRAALAATPWRLTNMALVALRVRGMAVDAEQHPEQRESLRGWVNRAVSFIV